MDEYAGKLNLQERLSCLWMYNLLLGFPTKDEMFGRMSALTHAWELTKSQIRRIYSKYVAQGFNLERKDRNNKDETVLIVR